MSSPNSMVLPLSSSLTAFDEWLETGLLGGENITYLLNLLLQLKGEQRRLAAIVNEIERTAAQQIPRRTFLGEGLKAEKSRTYADEWDVRRTAWAVVEPLLFDHATGEVLCDEATAWSLIDRLFAAASVKYYRAGELLKLGLNPEEFRTREFRRYTVKVERVDTEAGVT